MVALAGVYRHGLRGRGVHHGCGDTLDAFGGAFPGIVPLHVDFRYWRGVGRHFPRQLRRRQARRSRSSAADALAAVHCRLAIVRNHSHDE